MMDSSHLDQPEKSSLETCSDSSMSQDSSDINDIFGDPFVHPRVGDEYQVEIPYILTNSELSQLIKNPAESTERLENLDDPLGNYKNGLVRSKDIDNESWSDFEADCFLVGLYFLGKNLLQVTRFVESKGLGQILAYYYGKFYGSAGYRRWSDCRKMRRRKCIIGHQFFTGCRQERLFSRLFPPLSEECKAKLLEALKAFSEGSSSLDEYVFTLKAMVGINALVSAVGIGKGKEDLTTLIYDTSKNYQISSRTPEVPSGKACSTLTCSEIVKYLNGDFRLSKARSNDLFWEAIWPRLLERGWHSEQPKCNGYKGANHLVFLMPGIQKFSRRKLSKGEHYFDSVSDVLAKVTGEPELFQLEGDETNSSCSKGENGWSKKVKSDDDQDCSDHERRCYLKPRVSLGISDVTKFIIVDTSLANGNNKCNVTELRSLPVEANETELYVNADVLSNGLGHLRESSSDNVGSQRIIPFLHLNHNPMNHKPRTIKHQFSRREKSDLSRFGDPVTKRRRLSSGVEKDSTCVLSLPAKNRNATLRIVGPKLGQTDLKPTLEDILVADNHTEMNVQDNFSGNRVGFVISKENKKMPVTQQAIDLNLPQVPIEFDSDSKVNTLKEVTSSTQISSVDKSNDFDAEKQQHCDIDKQRHSGFGKTISKDIVGPSDIMVSQVKFDSQEPPNTAFGSAQQPEIDFLAPKPELSGDTVGPSNNMEPQVSSKEPVNEAVKSEQQLRRQSTRNRPLTTKALEALESSFISPVRKYRKRSPSADQDQKPKRSRHPRNKSSMFPCDMVSEVKESNEKENMSCELLKLPDVSFAPASTCEDMLTCSNVTM